MNPILDQLQLKRKINKLACLRRLLPSIGFSLFLIHSGCRPTNQKPFKLRLPYAVDMLPLPAIPKGGLDKVAKGKLFSSCASPAPAFSSVPIPRLPKSVSNGGNQAQGNTILLSTSPSALGSPECQLDIDNNTQISAVSSKTEENVKISGDGKPLLPPRPAPPSVGTSKSGQHNQSQLLNGGFNMDQAQDRNVSSKTGAEMQIDEVSNTSTLKLPQSNNGIMTRISKFLPSKMVSRVINCKEQEKRGNPNQEEQEKRGNPNQEEQEERGKADQEEQEERGKADQEKQEERRKADQEERENFNQVEMVMGVLQIRWDKVKELAEKIIKFMNLEKGTLHATLDNMTNGGMLSEKSQLYRKMGNEIIKVVSKGQDTFDVALCKLSEMIEEDGEIYCDYTCNNEKYYYNGRDFFHETEWEDLIKIG